MAEATNFHYPSPSFFRPHLPWLHSPGPDAQHDDAPRDFLSCRLAAPRI